MPNPKKPAAARVDLSAAEITARGPVGDKLAEIYKSLGLDMEEADYWKVCDALSALKTVATAENAVAGGAPADGERADKTTADDSTVRADAPEGEALAAFAGDVLSALKDIFAQPEADAAALLDMLKSSADAFKGALGGAAPADDAAEGGQDAAKSADDAAARADAIGMRAQLKANTAEIVALRAQVRAREVSDHIDATFRSAKLNPPQGDDRKELTALCDGAGDEWRRVVAYALRSVNVPPGGALVIPAGDAAPVTIGSGDDEDAMIRAAADEIKAKSPGLTRKQVRAQAYALMRSRKPASTPVAD